MNSEDVFRIILIIINFIIVMTNKDPDYPKFINVIAIILLSVTLFR